ncbi:hypothetical protein ACFWAY_47315 [Rhodococcus sp. NPDC059968]|uniref:hypothetical protein n=1 Tax=Rhodococcus sp. NPDC059968 TaxID=3347017 RepID=UPI00367259C5
MRDGIVLRVAFFVLVIGTVFGVVVNMVADLTYQWIPALLGLIDGGLTSQPDGGPAVESLAPLTMEAAAW